MAAVVRVIERTSGAASSTFMTYTQLESFVLRCFNQVAENSGKKGSEREQTPWRGLSLLLDGPQYRVLTQVHRNELVELMAPPKVSVPSHLYLFSSPLHLHRYLTEQTGDVLVTKFTLIEWGKRTIQWSRDLCAIFRESCLFLACLFFRFIALRSTDTAWALEYMSDYQRQRLTPLQQFRMGIVDMEGLSALLSRERLKVWPEREHAHRRAVHRLALSRGADDPTKPDYRLAAPAICHGLFLLIHSILF